MEYLKNPDGSKLSEGCRARCEKRGTARGAEADGERNLLSI